MYQPLQIQADWGKHRLRYDEIIPVAHYSLDESYWNSYLPMVAEDNRFYTNKLFLFLRYFGYQYWRDNWSITLEQVNMKMSGKEHYHGYEDFAESPVDNFTYRNAMFSAEFGKFNSYIGYGWSVGKEDKHSKLYGLKRGNSTYVGTEYRALDSLLLKAEVYQIYGTSFISYNENRERDEWKDNWNTYSLQAIWFF